jgi:hypothetical protein
MTCGQVAVRVLTVVEARYDSVPELNVIFGLEQLEPLGLACLVSAQKGKGSEGKGVGSGLMIPVKKPQ